MDGSIGSRTSALHTPYADAATTGHLYLTAEQVAEHVVACTRAGVQAGFHVIGDRAVAEVVAGLAGGRRAARPAALLQARHRLEHVEMADARRRWPCWAGSGWSPACSRCSTSYWGGRDSLYAQRLGADRALPMNAFASMTEAGVALAFGSDSPVTPLGPWAAVRAAAWHRTETERLTVPRRLQRPHPRRLARRRPRRGRRHRARRPGQPGGLGRPRRPRRADAGLARRRVVHRPPGGCAAPARPPPRPRAADLRADAGRRRGRVRARGSADVMVSTSSTTRTGSTTGGSKLDLDPGSVAQGGASLARKAGRPIVDLAKQHTTVSVERATLRLARPPGRRRRRHPVGEPAAGRRTRRRGARARRRAAGVGRAGARRGRRPRPRWRRRRPPARCASGCPRDATWSGPGRRRRKQVGAGIKRIDARRRERERLVKRYGDPDHQAVDLPHRRDRRHLRGHAAGAAGGPRGRRHHRGDPVHRAVAARLRARGRRPARASPAPTPPRRTSG